MLIGGGSGAPGLQAEAALLEEGRPGPRQARRTEVRGCWVRRWGLGWVEAAGQEHDAGGQGASTSFQSSRGVLQPSVA